MEVTAADCYKKIDLSCVALTKYLFFTGKGGVGKTTLSSSYAVNLAQRGYRVALISTDPASNLQDVFTMKLTNRLTQMAEVPNLFIANFEPLQAAEDYKNSVIEPYIGILSDDMLENMKEQLSGSCTVEVAAFNEFTRFIANEEVEAAYDYVIFDTAPTGHTLRMLELPSAWDNYLEMTSHDASCLGQLSGLDEDRDKYKTALKKLRDKEMTTLMLVARAEISALKEVKRAQEELEAIGVSRFHVIINGLITQPYGAISKAKMTSQQAALTKYEDWLKEQDIYYALYQSAHEEGISGLVKLLKYNSPVQPDTFKAQSHPAIDELVAKVESSDLRYLFMMGKGGVGKTTVARLIAEALAAKGHHVHLATTDPTKEITAAANDWLRISYIDEDEALTQYKAEVFAQAGDLTDDEKNYIEEDLRSPCTQEIAFFRAFSEIVADETSDYVIVDTAPTGHTLLLLDASESYHQEVIKNEKKLPEAVEQLLPKIKNNQLTEMMIITLPERTPYLEAARLADDLERAGIAHSNWVINQELVSSQESDDLFAAKKFDESNWIKKIREHSHGHYYTIPFGGHDEN
ncbi:arsenical pump-driving ATPase [Macrococcus brunensis]|uniref:arsenical pump-driving ATPase n=1 Tax=Macrococcus brunensis TaxID=198483 RepID=UPI001EF058DE|nr:arsenical pump-driving ATPase [Macrococcus brunensis]ULG74480.1 arsenical pump-driving ATPase [Macrococcus brunensis]